MAPPSDNKNFSFDSMDWDEYALYRPMYPQALYDLIYEYHASHGGTLDRAVDVGAGAGIVTRDLLKVVRHVDVTDASELYVSQAKKAFAGFDESRISFLQSRAEDLTRDKLSPPAPDGVDLITAATSLHWADVNASTARAHSLLRSGGTFAVWMYGILPIYPASDAAGHAVHDILNVRLVELYEKIVEPMSTGASHSAATTMHCRFDNLFFETTAWKDVRRIHTRRSDPMCALLGTEIPKNVHPDTESNEDYPDDALISREVDADWIEGYFQYLIPPLNMKEKCKKEFAELRRVMGDRKTVLKWPFVLLLATKR